MLNNYTVLFLSSDYQSVQKSKMFEWIDKYSMSITHSNSKKKKNYFSKDDIHKYDW